MYLEEFMYTFAILSLALTLSGGSKPATNGRCPVLGNPVADRNQVVTVRERDYRICCAECGQELSTNPDKFLTMDGTPKNVAKVPTAG